MLFEVMAAIIILGIVGALGLRCRINWQDSRGLGMGKRHMEELGLDDEKKEYGE